MQLIVAEKPSVARDLARVLGVRPAGQHAFEGGDWVITWCIGHLVELEEPAAYDGRWKAWRLDTLPMLPERFQLRPARHAVPQLRAVVKLLGDRRFSSVINACDAGREGELIFRYVVQYAGASPPVRRLWISSMTDDAIRRGFAALRPGRQLDPLGDAARSRSEADWLVGMNATRAITARGRSAGHAALYSIGRVQTPTLAMLVSREQAIQRFEPRPYWEVRGEFEAEGQRFVARWQRGAIVRLGSEAIAGAITARDAADGDGPRVERLRARTVREAPPLLFDLTALQRTANRRFGFSAARTLEIAQALYERHKVLTYPRTDARHLSSDVAKELPTLFEAIARMPEYAGFAEALIAKPPRPSRRVIDDAKIHDHHAIIPTGKVIRLEALDRDERRVFDLVVRRFLAAFYPDAEFAITEAWIRVGASDGEPPAFPQEERRERGGPVAHETREPEILGELPAMPDRYFARGRVRIAAGWQEVAGIEPAREGEEAIASLPALKDGQVLAGRYAAVAKQTTPPPRYSEATLLGAMESAGKTIDDEALRLAMKDTGLGTPATRAAVIETLLKREYIARQRQHLVPTPLGIALIDALPVADLGSPELTGAWEARLARIARGEESRDAFMADIARYVAELVDAIRGAAPPAAPASATSPPVGRCPRCGGQVVQRPREFACTAGCGFTMRNRVAGRAITAALAGVLLAHRRSQVLRGFQSRGGKRFAAALVLGDDGELTFDFGQAPERRDAGGSGADGRDEDAASEDGWPESDGMDERPEEGGRRSPARAFGPNSDRAPGREIRTETGQPRERSTTARRPSSRPRTRTQKPSGIARTRTTSLRSSPRAATGALRRTASDTGASDTPVAKARIEIAALTCPRCRAGTLLTGSRGWGCSRWKDGCSFVIWFETAGRTISPTQLRDLVTKGKTRKARFRAADGSERDGRLVLDPSAERGNARFEPD